MTERFFVQPPINASQVVLTGAEAQHAQVMRVRAGDQVILFDGTNRQFTACVESIDRRKVVLAVIDSTAVDRELPGELTLAVALPKGERQKWLVEKLVELGVSRLVPLRTERSVVQPGSNTAEKFERAVIEASKQCERNRLMVVAPPVDWPELVRTAAGVRLVAHPADREPPADRASVGWPDIGRGESVVVAIGPEGGLTPDEVMLAHAAGWRQVDLGSRILRVETAAIFAAAVVGRSLQRQ